MTRRIRGLLVVTALLTWGCAARRSPSAEGAERTRPVALLTEGSAFAHAGLQDTAARALAQATGREVVRLHPPSAAASRERVAARLARVHRPVAAYDCRERGCPADAAAATALDYDVDGVYRVRLDLKERAPVPSAGGARPGTLARALAAVRLERRPVGEETATGEIVAWTPGGGELRVPITGTATGRHLDLERVVREAVAGLPPLAEPRWDAVAKRLLASGCPLLALAVADARLEPAPERRRVERSALTAIRRRLDRQATRRTARDAQANFEAALRAGDLEQAAAILARYQAGRHDAATAARFARALDEARAAQAEVASAAAERQSCTALCSMHMVELCNNDRGLWGANHRAWEATPCGTQRTEAFLADCYRQQWLSGTFHDACVVPCERTTEGRARLRTILQGAGCLRAGAS